MTSRHHPATYTLAEGSEVSGVSHDLLWDILRRLGLSGDAVPYELAQELRWHVDTIANHIVQRDGATACFLQGEHGRRAMA